jgi:hypothetical protein
LTVALAPRAALAQKEFSDCRMGHIVLLLPGEKPPKGPGCGGVTATIDLAAAKSLVEGAIKIAAENARKMSDKDADVAGAISGPYAYEKLTEDAAAEKRVAEKELIWKTVHEKLLAARDEAKAQKDEEEPSGERIRDLNRLATLINAADAVRKDIAADKALLKDRSAKRDGESNEAMLKRKAALFAKLTPPKKNDE